MMQVPQELKDKARAYLDMVSEADSHVGDEARDEERTRAHNDLIREFMKMGIALRYRTAIRQLALYIIENELDELADKPADDSTIMFRKLGTNSIEQVIPFPEEHEQLAIKLYEPIWVHIVPISARGNSNSENLSLQARGHTAVPTT